MKRDSDESAQSSFMKYIQLQFKRVLWVTGPGHEGN